MWRPHIQTPVIMDQKQKPEEKPNTVIYVCGECHKENLNKPREPIRCLNCGHRILYKKRCKTLMVYDAR
uniref:DNA-directed RNA polymerases I, II, and III subunit RPABC4 n=1 Tax=Steinernema glaseri TaxID=37863 RepID=A0A1I7ZNR4_9BILA